LSVAAPHDTTKKYVVTVHVASLTTEHKDYVLNARQSKEARAIIPVATIALTSSHSRDTPWRPVTPHSPSFLFLARARQVGYRAVRLRAVPFSGQLRDCQGFDMSSRANSSDISLSTVSCVRTDCIHRVLNALKQIACDALGLDSILQFK
jgi:hypothetical protein